jgi:hypothetical protein
MNYIELTRTEHWNRGGKNVNPIPVLIPVGTFWVSLCSEGGSNINFFYPGAVMLVSESYEYIVETLNLMGHTVTRTPEEQDEGMADLIRDIEASLPNED